MVSWLGVITVTVATSSIVIASASVLGWILLALLIVAANLITVNICIPIFVSWEKPLSKTALSV